MTANSVTSNTPPNLQPALSNQPVPTTTPAPLPHFTKKPCRTVPFAAQAQWKISVTRALEDVSAAIDQGCEQGILASFRALLRLPALALTDTGASRGRARRVCTRLQHIDCGEDIDEPLMHEAGDQQPQRRARHAKLQQVARAHRQLTFGSITRAAKCLEAAPMAQPTPATISLLQALHPSAPPPPLPTLTAPAIITMDILTDVLSKLPKGSAPGPSGWTYEHVKVAMHGVDSARCAGLRVINAIVSGGLPHVPELLESTLIAIDKPNGPGVRPIAIGEVWYRIVGLCAMAACPDAGRSLAPLQMGVGVKGGSQIIGHAIRAGIVANPDVVTVQLDYRNAFNSLSRTAMLAAIAKRQPTLLPFATWSYRQPSSLIIPWAPAGSAPIMSECGVRQGDPCGVLYFSLTTQDQLESLRLTHPEVAPIAYTDDTFLQGSAEAVTAAFPTLRAMSNAIGLEVRLDKCGAYSANTDAAASTAAALGISHKMDGLVAAGSPIGTDAFLAAYANERANDVCKSIDDMLDTPLPTQDKYIILRSSAQMRLAHLPRVAGWNHIGEAVKRVEHKVVQAAFCIMRHPVQEAVRDGQLTLPLRLGGMGIRTTSALEASAAFLSAAAVTETAMRTGPLQFRPFSGPAGQGLKRDWEDVHSFDVERVLWPTEARTITDEVMDTTLPNAHRTLARFVADRRGSDLLASFDSNTEEGMRNIARMRSCACRPASLWLDTLPTCMALQLSNNDYVSAMRLRLGLTYLPPNAPGVQCSCGRHIEACDVDHAMTCNTLKGAATLRHEILKEIWRRITRRAGIASSVEPLLHSLPGAHAAAIADRPESRGDILLVLPDGLTVVDVSVVHPAASTYMHAARVEGGAAAMRDQAKRAQYESGDPNGYAFVPLSMESFGRLGKPAMQLLNTLATKAVDGGVVVKGSFVVNAMRELSVGLMKGNGLMFRRGLGVMAGITGTSFSAGFNVPTDDVL